MKWKIRLSKGFFWLQSLFLVALASYVLISLKDNMVFSACITLAIIINPKVFRLLLIELGENEEAFILSSKIEISFLMLFVAFALAFLFIPNDKETEIAVQKFESTFKIFIYVCYLIVMFMFKNANKVTKYVVFGLFYLICNILSFSSQPVIADFLNITKSEMDLSSYSILFNDILIPIKEAILTYIIFDTINDYTKSKRGSAGTVIEEKPEKTTVMDKSLNNKKQKYLPYGFDFKYEYHIYKNIGIRYKQDFISKIMRYNNFKYEDIDKRSSWEKYIRRKLPKDIINYNDMVSYLIDLKRKLGISKTMILTFAVSIYILVLSLYLNFGFGNSWVDGSVFLIACNVVLLYIYIRQYYYENRIYFLQDYIDVVKEYYLNRDKGKSQTK